MTISRWKVEVVRDLLEQRERLRDAVDERDGVVAEGRLERRVLEELVERDLRNRVALELDLDPHPGAVAVVGDVGDLGQHLLVHEVGDLLDHAAVAALLDAVGKLGDDDRALAAAQLLDVRPRPHDDTAAAGAVGVADAGAADDDRAGREVRALDVPHQRLDVRGRVVDQRDDRVDRLAEVVRRHVRRHPDRDPGRAVHEQVREPRRQHERLLLRLVVVRPEVDRVRVELGEHLLGELGEPRLGVVADEPVGEERVIGGVDPERVHGLDSGVRDGFDFGVEVLAGDERLDDALGLLARDPLEDRGAALLPALDPVDVVPVQPVALGPAAAGLGTDEVGHVRNVVV